jgi:hypothetical protein
MSRYGLCAPASPNASSSARTRRAPGGARTTRYLNGHSDSIGGIEDVQDLVDDLDQALARI